MIIIDINRPEEKSMGDKKYITKKILFQKTVDILIPRLNLGDWTITVINTKKMGPAADCEASPEYKDAVIRLNLEQLPGLSHTQVVNMAIHELVHCVVWPLATWAEELCDKNARNLKITSKLEESLVTNLEKILFIWVKDYIQDELKSDGYANVKF